MHENIEGRRYFIGDNVDIYVVWICRMIVAFTVTVVAEPLRIQSRVVELSLSVLAGRNMVRR
jgi:hypothetical protein